MCISKTLPGAMHAASSRQSGIWIPEFCNDIPDMCISARRALRFVIWINSRLHLPIPVYNGSTE